MNSKLENSIQAQLLQTIKDLIPSNLSLVDELADLLQVSPDSVYRRLRGETALTIEEVSWICKKYRISFDSLLNNSLDNIAFSYPPLHTYEDFRQYWLNIIGMMQKMKLAPNRQITYVADDIPISYHFLYPEHTAFKMFYWMQLLLKDTEISGKKFTFDLIKPELLEWAKQIHTLYCEIPSIEIWTDESPNSTFKQIEFHWESGLFADQKEAILVIEQYLDILKHIQKQAEIGKKIYLDQPRASFDLYFSEIQVGNNCVLMQAGNTQLAYVRHQTFNTMTTQNAQFCQETEEYIQTLIKKSVLISQVSERQRNQFFQKILKYGEKLYEKVKNS
jgi:transcriptional regulator with XRE-family HTH domain